MFTARIKDWFRVGSKVGSRFGLVWVGVAVHSVHVHDNAVWPPGLVWCGSGGFVGFAWV